MTTTKQIINKKTISLLLDLEKQVWESCPLINPTLMDLLKELKKRARKGDKQS